ncbi:hypothetical protein ACKWTF_013259 [Chironomus riparius]
MCKNLLKISTSILMILVLIQIENLIAGKSKQSLLDFPRFTRFSCEFSDEMRKIMHQNSSCFVSKIDKRLLAINMYIGFKIPTDHIFTQCIIFYKSDGSFREVVTIPEFDWCLIGRSSYDGFLMQQLNELVKRLLPHIMSKCPRKEVSTSNLTFPSHKFFSFLPTGLYKFIASVKFNQKGNILYNMTGQFVFDAYKDRIGS